MGFVVGLTVGFRLGSMLIECGSVDEYTVGSIVGSMVGSIVGSNVGFTVGFGVGSVVGSKMVGLLVLL